jgi:hypothetical protein
MTQRASPPRRPNAMRWRAAQLVGVQLVYFLRLLILAKLLAPDAFGLLAIATIAVGIDDAAERPRHDPGAGAAPATPPASSTTRRGRSAWCARRCISAAARRLAAPLIARLFDEPRATGIIQVLALRPLIESARQHRRRARLTRELQVPRTRVDQPAGARSSTSWWRLPRRRAGRLGAGARRAERCGHLHAVRCPTSTGTHIGRGPRCAGRPIAPLLNYGRWVLLIGVIGLAGTLMPRSWRCRRHARAAALGLFFLAASWRCCPIEAASAVIGGVAFPMFAGLREDRRAGRRAPSRRC